jgi:hypothetical protein
VCLAGLSCYSGICVNVSDPETSDDGDPGDGDPGDGDPGDGDPGDGDPGDGDPGDGDGDGDPNTDDPCGVGGEVLLYNQGFGFSNDPGILVGTLTDFNNAMVEVADEFVIPDDEQCWCITRVHARGFYEDGVEPASIPDVTIEFFPHNAAGVPLANPTVSVTGPATEPEKPGFLDVAFAEGIVLDAGTHWMSFSPIVTYSETFWRWKTHDELYGYVAAARDKAQVLFDGKCSGWTPGTACYSLEPGDPYSELTMQFEIFGVVGGEACN